MNEAPTLYIANTSIKQNAEGLYCLNDLHNVSGGAKRHSPNYWAELSSTKEFIQEIENDTLFTGNPVDKVNQLLITKSGPTRDGGGTYADIELVYEYAAWISPAFRRKVYRTFHKVQMEEREALARDATAYRALASSDNEMLISEAALTLNIKRGEFFKLLSDGLGWIYRRGNKWWPKQKAVADGFVSRRCHIYRDDEGPHRSYQTMITERGLASAQQLHLA